MVKKEGWRDRLFNYLVFFCHYDRMDIMKTETFTFKDETGLDVFVYKWVPSGTIKAVVQIAHGMAETAARYEGLAEQLTANGYLVYAHDHRGHGKTAGDVKKIGILGDDSFHFMVQNMRQLQGIINEQNPGLPVFLLGHSMGSFLLQRYLCLYGHHIQGAVLSGSNGHGGLLLEFGRLLARWEVFWRGRDTRSNLINKLSFGDYNKPFKPNRTSFDWLSRDEAEVDKYIANPYCGGVFSGGFFYDFFEGLKLIQAKKEIQKIPKDLPIFILSGDKDPVGKFGKGVMKLVQAYKRMGQMNVHHKLYPGGRHEMLNETNRKEVMQDIITWLSSKS
jgi:alpha-beta hydrolase superfamily lysophospholipase